eukprot:SAG22_NODE_4144_length_1368_cov_1.855004_3_plen_64_part_01
MPEAAGTLQELRDAVAAVTQRPEFDGARWGVCAQQLARGGGGGGDLVSIAADEFFVPASNTKLF